MMILTNECYQFGKISNGPWNMNKMRVLLIQMMACFVQLSSCADQEVYQFPSLQQLVSENVYIVLNAVDPDLKLDAESAYSEIVHAWSRSISKLYVCTELNLSSKGLKKLPCGVFGYMPNLKKLDISENPGIKLDFANNSWLGSRLVELNVDGGDLSIGDIRDVLGCKRLIALNLSYNDLSEIETWCAKSTSHPFGEHLRTQLVELKVSKCNLGGNFIRKLSECPCLRKLDLSRNNLADVEIQFGNLFKTLTDLSISACKLELTVISKISHFKSLEVLNMSFNRFSGIPEDLNFGNLANTLIVLNLRICRLTPNIFEKLGDLRFLRILNIGDNDLRSIPDTFDFKRLRALTELDLSHNMLACLPKKICKLSNLSKLELEYNNLASLPDDINKLSNLTELDLSYNRLREVPKNIKKLSKLTRLDLESCGLGENAINKLRVVFGNRLVA